MSPKVAPTITALVIFVVLIANNSLSITEAVNTDVVSEYCGEETYPAGDPYGDALIALLQGLVTTTENFYQYSNDATATIEDTGEIIYGHAKCQETLEPEECTQCLAAAMDYLLRVCALSRFAFLELVDCSMKYDDSPFQG